MSTDLTGRKTGYRCKACRREIFTVQGCPGDTPFWLRCEAVAGGCRAGTMTPFVVSQSSFASFEWYAPEPDAIFVLPPFAKWAAHAGQLWLRPIKFRSRKRSALTA